MIKLSKIAVVSAGIILILGGCSMRGAQSNETKPQDPTVTTTAVMDTTSTTTLATDATTDDPTRSTSTDPTRVTVVDITKPTGETTATQPSEPSTTEPTATEVPGETTRPIGVYVGPADPATGISWDGVSPIIYTYPDGTTGTVPIPGATYEVIPGVFTTYTVWCDGAGRPEGSTCAVCGRTVARWNSQGIYCVQNDGYWFCSPCGVWVGAYTCHTCTNYVDGVYYCEYCGRIEGDGSNGTCVRWDFVPGDHPCPCCGTIVPEYTCHTCNEG